MVTVHDVARAAGVSISTVSRALAGKTVAPATRERVVLAAAQLGYEPNRAAAGLRHGRTGALGVVVPDLENPYFASVAKGVQARARQHGYGVVVVDVEEDAAREADDVRALLGRTDGVVLASPRSDDATLAALLDGPRPGRCVLVNRELPGVPSVSADEEDGAAQALAHLRALGHRRVAYLGGPPGSWSDRRRRAGLRRAAQGAADVEVVELGAVRPHLQGGYSGADLVQGAGATAVVAYNDLVALGVERRLLDRGVPVPQAVSIVGFDDTFVATLAARPLTTVRTDLHEIGARAVELLLGLLDDGARPVENLVLPVELVVRASTGTAPGAPPLQPALDAPGRSA